MDMCDVYLFPSVAGSSARADNDLPPQYREKITQWT